MKFIKILSIMDGRPDIYINPNLIKTVRKYHMISPRVYDYVEIAYLTNNSDDPVITDLVYGTEYDINTFMATINSMSVWMVQE